MKREGGSSGARVAARQAVLSVLAGVLLAALLVLLAPAVVVLRVAEPVTGLVPMMLSGVHGVEENYGHMMRWTTGQARVRWPGQVGIEPGAVAVSLAGFPGRQPDHFDLRINGRRTRHPVPEHYGEIRVDLPRGTRAPLDISIVSLTTRPPGDARDLGVRLETITIENRPLAARLRGMVRPGVLGVVLFGALAWLAGGWAAGAGASPTRRTGTAAATWGVTAVLTWLLAATALREEPWLLLPPMLLGLATTFVLARGGQPRVLAAAVGLIASVQAVVILTWFSSAFVDAPRWDIWDIVPLLVKQDTQGLTLRDLWAPHNEHRPTVARVVLLANVSLSRWNHWNELWLMLIITAAHFLVYVGALRRTPPARAAATVLAIAGAGTFVATATQWENFLQGWQVALILGAMAMSAAFVLLSAPTVSWARLVGAALLVLLGTAGFASCLIGWPLGVVAMAVRRGPRWPLKCGVWLAVGVLVGAAYVHGLQRPAALPPPAPVLTSLTAQAQVTYGTLMALAMPVWYAPMSFSDTASVAWWLLPTIGACGVGLAVALVSIHLWRAETRRAQAWLLPSLLIAFALAACGMTAVGRVPLGMHAMTASRYIVFTSLFWIGLILLLTVATPFASLRARRAGLALAAVIVVAGLRGWVDSLPYIEQHYVGGSLGREALLRGDIEGAIVLFPVPPVLDERRQFLMRHQLSLYRPGAR